jgi:hypothetical protein
MENVLISTAPLGAPNLRAARASLWIGRVLTGLCVALLLLDALGKLLALAPVVAGTRQLGFVVGVIRPLGLLLAVSTLLHVIPRTQMVGALLLTAYLGGATASQVRAGQPFWFPVAMGAIIWAAYALRSPALRALLLPTRSR